MNEYPSMDDVALRILEVLAPIFPRDVDFEQVVTALPGVSQDDLLSRIDDMQKLGWVNGPLIRTGVDKRVKAVFRCHLTAVGRNWLLAEGVFDLGELTELCERKFKSVRDFAYSDIRAEFRPIIDHYEKSGIHELNHFVESTCELVFARMQRIKEAFFESYLKTIERTQIGITSARKLWLLRILNEKWEPEVQRAQEQAEVLTGASGFPRGRTHAWIANLVGRGRELKQVLENDINVAVLERVHRAPEQNSVITNIVMRDQISNYGHVGAIGEHSSGTVKEQLAQPNRVDDGVDALRANSSKNSLVKPRHNVQCVGFELISDDLLSVATLRFQNVPTPGKLMGKFEYPRLRVVYYVDSTGQEIADLCPLQWYGAENGPNEITAEGCHAQVATFLIAARVWRLFEVNESSEDFDDWHRLRHIEVPAGEYRIIARLSGSYDPQLHINSVFGVLKLREDGTASFQPTDE